jgi:hypothetical protein
MANVQNILREIDQLTADELKQVYTYILEHRVQFVNGSDDANSELPPRVLGLHAHLGKPWLSDDFDAELPDSFWLGDNSESST